MRARFFIMALTVVAAIDFSGNIQARANEVEAPGILKALTAQGLRYLTGGVGSDEREIMAPMGADYSTKLVFAGRSGNYLAAVRVAIKDQSGKALGDIKGAGPWLYIQLPPGIYDVDATFEGKTVEIDKLQVPKGKSVVQFIHWKSY